MKLLTVDDNIITGKILTKVISSGGYDVTHLTNGNEALALIREGDHRIVITDWMMPEMDGLSLCRHIRELNLRRYIYIILLTSKESKTDSVAGFDAGADDYIVKPFDSNELMARIRAGRRLVTLEDVNRETQAKLARSEKMAAVGHLAAGVAHEINNPIGFMASNLNSLRSYMRDITAMLTCYRELVQALERSFSKKKMSTGLPEMIRRAINMENDIDLGFMMDDVPSLIDDCSGGAARIQAIVNAMSYFAHPNEQSIEWCALEEILGKVVRDLSSQSSPGVKIQRKTDHLPPIECNIAHMEKALRNIIQNAIEAIDGSGDIQIEGKHCDGAVDITITDTGRGISPANLPKVFNPFFTTKDVGQGIGLGLTTALNIVRMHNGTIDCASKPGRTSFTVTLPVGRPPVRPSS